MRSGAVRVAARAARGRGLARGLRARHDRGMRALLFASVLLLAAFASPAQEGGSAGETAASPSGPADFDYLLGDWEFTATSRQWGTFEGVWSAVRLAEGQILDEYRVLDDEGGTIYVTTTLRNFNESAGKWDLVGADAGGGLRDTGTAEKVGAEMRIEQTFGATSEHPESWRIRYFDIRPDRFSWAANVSHDGGKTWVERFQTIEARRIGPARDLPPLTPQRPQAPPPGTGSAPP